MTTQQRADALLARWWLTATSRRISGFRLKLRPASKGAGRYFSPFIASAILPAMISAARLAGSTAT